MSDQMTRRELVAAGLVLGGCLLLPATGCSMPAAGPDPDLETPTSRYGGTNMTGSRILVGYATRAGSTVGVAEEIGRTLAGRGCSVDVKPLKDAPSLDGYDAAVLGSAISGAKWLPEAVGFVESNSARLSNMRVALFCVHAMNTGDSDRARAKRLAYLDPVRALVEPADEGFFAGKGPEPDETSRIARWAFRAFGGEIEGDGRDWDAIRGWAGQLAI